MWYKAETNGSKMINFIKFGANHPTLWLRHKNVSEKHKARGSKATENVSVKHKAWGCEATKNASAKHKAWGSEATDYINKHKC